MSIITPKVIDNAYSYKQYREMVDELLNQGKTTGMIQTDNYVEFTRLNNQRMNRLEKTTVLTPYIIDELRKLKNKFIWIIITEAWCGDAANIVPVIFKIASETELIKMKLILRDENLEIMDKYLTNGGRSIPKLICLNADTMEEICVWGPRPKVLQGLITSMKSNPDFDNNELKKFIQTWYFNDKTIEIQNEIRLLINRCSNL